MTGIDFRNLLRHSVVTAILGTLWIGILGTQIARAATAAMAGADFSQMQLTESDDVRPVWIVIAYEVNGEKLISVTAFMFETREECQQASTEVRKQLGLKVKPTCYLKWLKRDGMSQGDQM